MKNGNSLQAGFKDGGEETNFLLTAPPVGFYTFLWTLKTQRVWSSYAWRLILEVVFGVDLCLKAGNTTQSFLLFSVLPRTCFTNWYVPSYFVVMVSLWLVIVFTCVYSSFSLSSRCPWGWHGDWCYYKHACSSGEKFHVQRATCKTAWILYLTWLYLGKACTRE